jgi:hypothetical protein
MVLPKTIQRAPAELPQTTRKARSGTSVIKKAVCFMLYVPLNAPSETRFRLQSITKEVHQAPPKLLGA